MVGRTLNPGVIGCVSSRLTRSQARSECPGRERDRGFGPPQAPGEPEGVNPVLPRVKPLAEDGLSQLGEVEPGAEYGPVAEENRAAQVVVGLVVRVGRRQPLQGVACQGVAFLGPVDANHEHPVPRFGGDTTCRSAGAASEVSRVRGHRCISFPSVRGATFCRRTCPTATTRSSASLMLTSQSCWVRPCWIGRARTRTRPLIIERRKLVFWLTPTATRPCSETAATAPTVAALSMAVV